MSLVNEEMKHRTLGQVESQDLPPLAPTSWALGPLSQGEYVLGTSSTAKAPGDNKINLQHHAISREYLQ